ncbi:response regulator transcription factor [Dyadobacter chenwenxiniae]|uniref:Response regulator transcription factor n=1 Tax=Dyadobacter chenwenxiniae TaxID=2906456 RepID=A0A9X1PL18_9BACT|nr:response regulator transcription factor [Dyadobacter chenwenxiniae]MCF0052975.1 response regulator transcription factor [Dyadobacter chenwenxiniae]MCF0061458.1 response regulator transcription factor [Dyadobacter chenwenxiniae]UON81281.1 response regulator transcription factor [Dyadobacter chenwenxiniae]
MSVKILIVDDHPLVLEGLKSLLSESEGISVVGTATNAIDAIAFLKSNEVDLAFLDINLPDISGIELCKKVKDQFPEVKTLALSTFSERAYVSRMIQNGASGYLIKSSSKEEILEAIQQVQAGGYFMNVNFDQAAAPAPKTIPFLTRREKEVLILIAEGLTNPQIADKLFISVTTVNSHRQNLLMKFEVSNTASLIKLAAGLGLI